MTSVPIDHGLGDAVNNKLIGYHYVWRVTTGQAWIHNYDPHSLSGSNGF